MGLTIFAGPIEFVTVSMLLGPFDPLSALLMTLMINARHLFYGISMLDQYRGVGWKKPYLIFGMCDETFSINYTANIPENVDRGRFMFFVTLLSQFYWVSGATIGGLVGSLITFSTEGLDFAMFAMLAMFVMIFMDQWMKEKQHLSSLVGLGLAAACLAIFGPDQFMIPSMISILVVLSVLRKKITALQMADELTSDSASSKTDDLAASVSLEENLSSNAARKPHSLLWGGIAALTSCSIFILLPFVYQ